MKVRFKVSSLKFVRFFVNSVDFNGSRKSEKLQKKKKTRFSHLLSFFTFSKSQVAVKVNKAKGKYSTNSVK